MNLRILTACLVVFAMSFGAYADFEAPDAQTLTPDESLARPWQLTARSFFGYSDNVQLIPDTTFFVGDGSDSFAGVSLVGSYRLVQDRAVTVYLLGEVSQLLYLGNPAGGGGSSNDYDLFVASPGVLANIGHSFCGHDANASVRYNFRFEAGRDVEAIGLSSHNFALTQSVELCEDTIVFASISHGLDYYEVAFPTPATDDRDGVRTTLSTGIEHRWDHNRRKVAFTYAFTHNDAEGSNFDYDSHAVTGRFETHLIGSLWGAAELGFSDSDYDGFASGFIPAPGRTEQQSLNTQLQFIYVIDVNWSIDLGYGFTEYFSNLPQFESQVNQFTIGVSYKF